MENSPWDNTNKVEKKTFWGKWFTLPKTYKDADEWCSVGAVSAAYISLTFFIKAFFIQQDEFYLLVAACVLGLLYLVVAYFLYKGNRVMGIINFVLHIFNVGPLIYVFILAGGNVKPPIIPIIAALASIPGLIGPFLKRKYKNV